MDTNNLPPATASFIEFSTRLFTLVDHEPPIGVGEGSVLIDIPRTLNVVDTPGPPFIYTFSSNRPTPTHFTNISGLLVTTERTDGFVDVDKYTLPNSQEARLHIWLDDPAAPVANFILEAINPNLRLTINAALDPANMLPHPNKPSRPFRRFCTDPALHAKKWALMRSDGSIVTDPLTGRQLTDAGDESYAFYVSFAHTH